MQNSYSQALNSPTKSAQYWPSPWSTLANKECAHQAVIYLRWQAKWSVYLVLGLGLIVLSGNFLNRSPKWSIGAVINPTTVSNGGLLGAFGWLRLGTKAFVRPKDLAIDSLSAVWIAASSAGRSSFSSSLICAFRSFMSASRVGRKSELVDLRFWNFFKASLTCGC